MLQHEFIGAGDQAGGGPLPENTLFLMDGRDGTFNEQTGWHQAITGNAGPTVYNKSVAPFYPVEVVNTPSYGLPKADNGIQIPTYGLLDFGNRPDIGAHKAAGLPWTWEFWRARDLYNGVFHLWGIFAQLGNLRFQLSGTRTRLYVFSTNSYDIPDINTNGNHYCLQCAGGGAQVFLYVNGVKCNTGPASYGTNSADQILIGAMDTTYDNAFRIGGYFDDVRFSKVVRYPLAGFSPPAGGFIID